MLKYVGRARAKPKELSEKNAIVTQDNVIITITNYYYYCSITLTITIILKTITVTITITITISENNSCLSLAEQYIMTSLIVDDKKPLPGRAEVLRSVRCRDICPISLLRFLDSRFLGKSLRT